ncbi:MAG: type pilus assembly protein PilQ [Chthoniobacter sp.]|nr:type pilus assembly protein PilQ [Chthoniobacter sp.]
MPKLNSILAASCVLSLGAAFAQQPSPVPIIAAVPGPITPEIPAPIDPPISALSAPATPAVPDAPVAATPGTAATPATATTTVSTTVVSGSSASNHALNEFQGDDVSQVLRLLARQAKINLVVSDKVDATQPPLKVTMRLEDKTPIEAIHIIATSKGLIMDQSEGVYFIKTKEEKEAEPTESASYMFSYGSAEKVLPLLAAQLQSKVAPQFDARTNTVFYREVGSNMDKIKLFLTTIDCPTQQVMIEARLVEVTANPKQSYGINWAGVVGGSTSAQTVRYGASNPATIDPQGKVTPPTTEYDKAAGGLKPRDFFLDGHTAGNFLSALGGQFAILSVPQMSATLRLMNEDSDAEFLANPRIVTANNQQATIKITRNQPVPQLNFNEQTATAVFGGFQDKEFGNTLVVMPSINKDDFVTMMVKPEISNKVGDSIFTFAGATVTSPIIDKRNLESNVLIKSGDTLAIGGLLQDEVTKSRSKVPILGDIPFLGYAFQERLNARTKRNLLVFVTPTIIKQGYGTGLEDQVSGIHHSGEEYADPNGWRNNAKGAIRLTPTSNRQNAMDYPKPGTPVAPKTVAVKYKVTSYDREK